MRKWKLVVVGLGLAVLVAVGAFVLWPRPRPDPITAENFSRIKMRMSQSEVKAILGPAGDYTTGMPVKTDTLRSFGFDEYTADPVIEDLWESDKAFIAVWYSDSLHVVQAEYGTVQLAPAIDNFLWRAKLQWQKWFPE
jgi:hypothetical protein